MQEQYKIKAIINNNFISTNKNSTEVIFMGKGIAFGKKVGDLVDTSRIEKTFTVENDLQKEKFDSLTRQIDPEVLNVSVKVVELFEKNSTVKIDTAMYMALSDHIAFALERKKAGQELSNKMLNEVKRFYPEEIELAKKALDVIKAETGIYLSEDEAGFLAIHLINATGETKQMGLEQVKAVTDIVNIVQDYFEMIFDEESFYYQRLITHLKFFVSRVFSEEEVDDSSIKDDFFYRVSKVQYPTIHKCVDLIAQYLDFNYEVKMKNEEKGFLVIHLCGLLKRKNK